MLCKFDSKICKTDTEFQLMTCMLKCLGAKCTDNDNVFEMHQKIKQTGRKMGSDVIKNSKEQNSKMLMNRNQVMSIQVLTEKF